MCAVSRPSLSSTGLEQGQWASEDGCALRIKGTGSVTTVKHAMITQGMRRRRSGFVLRVNKPDASFKRAGCEDPR